MNSENAKYLFSILDKMTVGFMGVFFVSSSGKKRISSGFFGDLGHFYHLWDGYMNELIRKLEINQEENMNLL